MMTESESDVTSDSSTSPPHGQYSKLHPLYFVQSPSRDSQDDKSSSSSIAASSPPLYCSSPMDSPTYSSSSGYDGRSSSESSSAMSRVSGKFRWSGGSSESFVPLRRGGGGGVFVMKRSGCSVIDEEEDYDDCYDREDDDDSCETLQCRSFIAVFGLCVVFFVSCLIVWGFGKPFKPEITVQSLTVYNFNIWDGSDFTGVPTKFLTVNSSLNMVIYNPATFFGIHVSPAPVDLLYSTLTIATGQIEKYYQPKKRHQALTIKLVGKKVPLYGAGPSLARSNHYGGIPITIAFEIQTQGNLVVIYKSTLATYQLMGAARDLDAYQGQDAMIVIQELIHEYNQAHENTELIGKLQKIYTMVLVGNIADLGS